MERIGKTTKMKVGIARPAPGTGDGTRDGRGGLPGQFPFRLDWMWSLSPVLTLPLSALCVSVTQSGLTLCDPMDCSPPSSSVPGILQARILGWVAIFFSKGFSRPRDQTRVSCIAGRCFTLSVSANHLLNSEWVLGTDRISCR